jgi:hypothetical protein
MELTERLELSTSPLPRECSTTELRQPLKPTLQSYRETMPATRGHCETPANLPRTPPCQQNPEREKPEQDQAQAAKLARLDREPGTRRQNPERDQRNHHATAPGRAQIHLIHPVRYARPATLTTSPPDPQTFSKSQKQIQKKSANPKKISGAQGRIRTSVTHRVADLQSAAINHSATCAHPATHIQPAASSPQDPDLTTPNQSSARHTAATELRRVRSLEEWWSATRQNDPQLQPNPCRQPTFKLTQTERNWS